VSDPCIHLDSFLVRFPQCEFLSPGIQGAFATICAALRGSGTLFVCGNGGSAADSEHIVGELQKGFLLPRGLSECDRATFCDIHGRERGGELSAHLQYGLRAISLTGHPSLATAVANDTSADMVFAQQLFALGRKGDVLLALSTSGNSANVLRAVEVAVVKGITVVGMTGESGGRLGDEADFCIRVPARETFLVQELHVPVYHTLCAMLESEFFGGAS